MLSYGCHHLLRCRTWALYCSGCISALDTLSLSRSHGPNSKNALARCGTGAAGCALPVRRFGLGVNGHVYGGIGRLAGPRWTGHWWIMQELLRHRPAGYHAFTPCPHEQRPRGGAAPLGTGVDVRAVDAVPSERRAELACPMYTPRTHYVDRVQARVKRRRRPALARPTPTRQARRRSPPPSSFTVGIVQ
jgi:hypothetical protein